MRLHQNFVDCYHGTSLSSTASLGSAQMAGASRFVGTCFEPEYTPTRFDNLRMLVPKTFNPEYISSRFDNLSMLVPKTGLLDTAIGC